MWTIWWSKRNESREQGQTCKIQTTPFLLPKPVESQNTRKWKWKRKRRKWCNNIMNLIKMLLLHPSFFFLIFQNYKLCSIIWKSRKKCKLTKNFAVQTAKAGKTGSPERRKHPWRISTKRLRAKLQSLLSRDRESSKSRPAIKCLFHICHPFLDHFPLSLCIYIYILIPQFEPNPIKWEDI